MSRNIQVILMGRVYRNHTKEHSIRRRISHPGRGSMFGASMIHALFTARPWSSTYSSVFANAWSTWVANSRWKVQAKRSEQCRWPLLWFQKRGCWGFWKFSGKKGDLRASLKNREGKDGWREYWLTWTMKMRGEKSHCKGRTWSQQAVGHFCTN